MKIEYLLCALDEMVIELTKNGRKCSADFFSLKYRNIKSSVNCLESIKELSTSRSMAQYANFSIEEEEKLNEIVSLATDILTEHGM